MYIDGDILVFDDKTKVKFFAESDPRTIYKAALYIKDGIEKIIIIDLSKYSPMFVMGVINKTYDGSSDVVSNDSCTTNCLDHLAKVLHKNIRFE